MPLDRIIESGAGSLQILLTQKIPKEEGMYEFFLILMAALGIAALVIMYFDTKNAPPEDTSSETCKKQPPYIDPWFGC